MENVEIAHVLSKYADLLEIQGADLFRIQAYRNAARTIESLSQPIVQLLEEGKDLKKLKLPGIGKSMSEHIEEIVKTGTLARLEGAAKNTSCQLGRAARRSRDWDLNERNSFTSNWRSARLRNSTQAIDSGKVESLAGFGEKSVEKIRQAIHNLGETSPSVSNYWTPTSWCVRWSNHLRKGGNIEQLEVAGSYRRRMETVGDIDILAASDNAKDSSCSAFKRIRKSNA